MVKPAEIKEVLTFKNKIHLLLMIYTAVMIPFFGFMPAVLSAIVIYIILNLAERYSPKLKVDLKPLKTH